MIGYVWKVEVMNFKAILSRRNELHRLIAFHHFTSVLPEDIMVLSLIPIISEKWTAITNSTSFLQMLFLTIEGVLHSDCLWINWRLSTLCQVLVFGWMGAYSNKVAQVEILLFQWVDSNTILNAWLFVWLITSEVPNFGWQRLLFGWNFLEIVNAYIVIHLVIFNNSQSSWCNLDTLHKSRPWHLFIQGSL